MNLYRIKHHLDRTLIYPMVVLDIGACRGQWCKEFKRLYTNTLVHQFEANPDMKDKLSGVYDIVLLGKENKCNIPFYKGGDDTGNSIYVEQSKYYQNCEVISLDMFTLDTVLQDKYQKIDLIKLDTQGSELDILRGAEKTVSKTDLILLEVSFQQYNKDSPLASDVFNYMSSIGFQAIDILEKHYFSNIFIQADILFARKESKYIISYFE